jgi:hypothetical protein
MPVFDLICENCSELYSDEWGRADDVKQIPCHCGGTRRIVIHAVPCHWGTGACDPGEVRSFEMEYAAADGKIHRKDMRHTLNQPKGQLTTKWDGKKVSPKEVEALAADADPNA